MKATINTYKTNATLFFNGNACDINWDGMTFDDIDEWYEWASDELEPARWADNYQDIRERIYIATQHLINDDMKRYYIDYADGSGSGCGDFYKTREDAERHMSFYTAKEREGLYVAEVSIDFNGNIIY